MFRVSTNIEKTITKKKKLLFISTLSSNETSSFEPKNFENSKTQYQTISKSTSLSTPLPLPKKVKKFFGNSDNKFTNQKKLPIKRIFFHLYHVNLMNQKKEKGKPQLHQKDNNFKKNGTYNLKHKQRHIQNKNNNISFNNKSYSSGRWKSDEHQRFIDAIIKYGNNWRQVQKCVGTRSSTQTRSHAQKFFEKLKRAKIFKREKYDFSKNSLKILHDIMKSLPDKEFNQTLKALHSLSYERYPNLEKDNNNKNNNDLDNVNFNENILENNDGNNNNNNEENIKCIKFTNQGYCFLESNNNKSYNNEDYMIYNISNNGNINSNNIICNNYNINEYLNYDIKPGRKESDILTQRKNSLSEFNSNIKDLKEQNNNIDDFNLDYNLNSNLFENNNYFSLNIQQDNKNINNKIFEEDKNDYRQQFNNIDFLFNQQTSRKMSLEEKVIN